MTKARLKYGLIGDGPVGSVIAAHLAQGGAEVSVFCVDIERARALEKFPIIVSGQLHAFGRVKSVYMNMSDFLEQEFDVILLATKTVHNQSLIRQIKSSGGSGKAVIVACQNGWAIEDQFAEAFGIGHSMRMVLNFGCGFFSTHEIEVKFNKPHVLSLNEAVDRRLSNQLTEELCSQGFAIELKNNYRIDVFKKVILNSSLGSVCALSDLTMRAAMESPEIESIIENMVKEGILLAQKAGYDLPDLWLPEAITYLRNGGDHRPSIALDIQFGRPTENEDHCGAFVRLAEKLAVNVPVISTVYYLMKNLESNILKKKKVTEETNVKTMSRVAVFGAGTMGSAIAQHFCMKGFEVQLVDLNPLALEKAQSIIQKSLSEAKERKIMSEEAMQAALKKLTLTTKIEDISSSQLVIEAIFEDREVKNKLFLQLEKILSADCIIASNTSSFLITDLANGMEHPERFVGVHYFYHAAKNKLVEIIAGERTSPRVVETLDALYRTADKIPILVKDVAGFAVNRFFVPWLNEATRLYQEGLGSIAYIDEIACRVFQIGLGPFALMNATGVPIAMHAAQGLADVLGNFYLPSEILKKQVASKQDWDLLDSKVLQNGSDNENAITERLLAASVGIAAALVDEGVTDAASVDLGARVGLRWAKGPFELLASRGQNADVSVINKCMAQWQLPIPRFPLKLNWLRAEYVKDSAFIIFDIPDRMNPLSEEVVEGLEEMWNAIEKNPVVKKVYFLGRGKAFMAGADIKFFLDAMDKGDYRRISAFTEKGQRLFSRFANGPKTTIAYLNGLTLGGGLELALSCNFRVASKKAVLAFPETGIGIYPGLGGTQRTSRLLGTGLAKYLVATGSMIDAVKALRFGLVDMVIEPVNSLLELTQIGELTPQKGREPSLPEEVFSTFMGTFDDFNEPFVKENEKLLRRKAPKALAMAMHLIDEGGKLSLDDGLKLELKHLEEIFRTKDAHTGLSGVISKARPNFIGQ